MLPVAAVAALVALCVSWLTRPSWTVVDAILALEEHREAVLRPAMEIAVGASYRAIERLQELAQREDEVGRMARTYLDRLREVLR